MAKSGAIYFTGREGRECLACTTSFSPRTCELQALSKLDYLAMICCNQAFRVALTGKVARLIHIMAAESERGLFHAGNRDINPWPRYVAHIRPRHFMLQLAMLCACYKVASGWYLRPCYASQAQPFFRENRTFVDCTWVLRNRNVSFTHVL